MNNIHQFKIPAHKLNRNRSSQDVTEVYDVTSKESFSNEESELGKINKQISDGVNKLKTVETKEAKDFSKSEAALVDVMDTFLNGILIIERKKAKKPIFMQKVIDTRNTKNATVALITKEDLNVNGFQQTVSMMKRITEQITDVSRGNTAALVVIEQFL